MTEPLVICSHCAHFPRRTIHSGTAYLGHAPGCEREGHAPDAPDPSERLTVYHCLICDHNAGGPTCQKCGQPANVLLGFCTLGPCTRDGSAEMGDWWRERHTMCTGSHHLGPGEIMLCDCTCHATREDWFKIAHFVHGEPVEGTS